MSTRPDLDGASRSSACSAIAAASTATKARCSPGRSRASTRPARASSATIASGGTGRARTAKSTMSTGSEPRTAKNAGVVADDVEVGLRDGEAPEHGEVHAAGRELAPVVSQGVAIVHPGWPGSGSGPDASCPQHLTDTTTKEPKMRPAKLTALAATAAIAVTGIAPATGMAKATGKGKHTRHRRIDLRLQAGRQDLRRHALRGRDVQGRADLEVGQVRLRHGLRPRQPPRLDQGRRPQAQALATSFVPSGTHRRPRPGGAFARSQRGAPNGPQMA